MKNHNVYQIKNQITGKYYIGRTCELKKRFERHLRELRKNKHHCIFLQRAWNKYGEDTFEFHVIHPNLTEKEAIDTEQNYLDNKKEELYNVSYNSTGGDLMSNHPLKEEIRKKISRSINEINSKLSKEEKKLLYGNKGEKNPMYGQTHSKETMVIIKDKLKEYYKEHDGYRKDKTWEELFGEKKTKEMRENLSKAASERTGEKNSFYGRRVTEEIKEKRRKNFNRKVMVNGELFKNSTEAAKYLNVAQTTIVNRINSNNSKFKGYMYCNEIEKISVIEENEKE